MVEGERIQSIVPRDQVPAQRYEIQDFGNAAILPGLVDSHVHINEPGRTDWEGFETATRAAAAGGYTMLVDMPLNCLPATTNVAALEAKRAAAQGKCRVDWAAWGGVVHDNQSLAHDLRNILNSGSLRLNILRAKAGVDFADDVDALARTVNAAASDRGLRNSSTSGPGKLGQLRPDNSDR